MLFTSTEFLIFLPIVFLLYWFVFQKNLKLQNYFILAISYLFYGWWDWRCLFLVIFCSGINYLAGLKLASDKNIKSRKLVLSLSCVFSIGLLGVFKYFNFFVDNFISAFASIGIHLQARTLNIVLPVGISFYTLKALGYTIDVYKGKLEATKDMIAFFSFVGFFPQLLAGPIDRATTLLPQFYVKRTFEYHNAVEGMRQILWGFLKKIMIADKCAIYVNEIFANHETLPAGTLVLGAIYFAFQIYADFSGYSDIAIGTSRLFGFTSMQNFNVPYFSRDIAEFWRRWHISLTTWFRDYLYIPLGGNRGTKFHVVRNTFIIFLICGFWHGANWTFIMWGLINALYFLPLLLLGKNRKNTDTVAHGRILPNIKELFQMGTTFALAVFAWIFFRADSIGQAFSYIGHIFSKSLLSAPKGSGAAHILPLLLIMILLEWFQREELFATAKIGYTWPKPVRWSCYAFIIFLIGMYMQTTETPFIYFQF
ncbi:MAG TPA: MBOAT family O-acyltransferase [Syntrophorhabdaceae bacterium]|jgi:D-alanyl-lipoteichoic acid acyltransferase DltB (MBOAT superfamily)